MLAPLVTTLLPQAAAAPPGELKPPGSFLERARRHAVLGLDPRFEDVYRRARQLNETRIQTYYPIGDLNSDGFREVIVARWKLTDDPAGVFILNLTGEYQADVLNGRTGRHMWSVTSTFVDGFAGARSFRVGGNERGLLLVETSLFSTGYTVTLTALDSDGNVLWRRVLPSTYRWTTSWTATDALVAVEVLKTRGKGDDVLIGQADYLNVSRGAAAARTDVSVIEGDTGTMRTVASEMSTETVPMVGHAPDVDADGTDDFVILGDDLNDDGHFTAISSTSGERIWSTRAVLKGYAWAHPIGDFLRNNTNDLIVGYWINRREVFMMVDGATGKVRWTREAIFPYVIGDIDRDGRPDIGAFLLGGKHTFVAFSNDGRRLYEVEHKPDVPPCTKQFCFTFGFYLHAGDLNADRVWDRYVELATSWTNDIVKYLVNGRTGTRMHESDSEVVPLVGSVDGRGDDVAIAKENDSGLSLEVADGNTLDPIWTARFRGPTARRFADSWTPYNAAVTLRNDDCDDVLIGVSRGTRLVLFALDGRDGSVLWKSAAGGGGRASSHARVVDAGC